MNDDQWHLCLCVCMSPNLVDIQFMADARHALILGSKGQRLRSHGYQMRCKCRYSLSIGQLRYSSSSGILLCFSFHFAIKRLMKYDAAQLNSVIVPVYYFCPSFISIPQNGVETFSRKLRKGQFTMY